MENIRFLIVFLVIGFVYYLIFTFGHPELANGWILVCILAKVSIINTDMNTK